MIVNPAIETVATILSGLLDEEIIRVVNIVRGSIRHWETAVIKERPRVGIGNNGIRNKWVLKIRAIRRDHRERIVNLRRNGISIVVFDQSLTEIALTLQRGGNG